jgi:hypothetical protein
MTNTNSIKRNSVVKVGLGGIGCTGVVESIVGQTAVVSWTVNGKKFGDVEIVYAHELLSDLTLVAA